MRNIKPNFQNRPKHLKQDDSVYFITGRTVDGQWFLRPEKYKQIFFDTLAEKTEKFSFDLLAYAILNNHYHLLLKVGDAETIKKFIGELNGASSKKINDADGVVGRKIWWNYYDHIIRNEADFYKHLNYIHQNPIKHGLSREFEYQFSSYNAWVKKKGREYLDDCFRRYPIIDFKSFNDEF